MADMDANSYVDELKQYHATVVTLNAAGIIASYPTEVAQQKQSDYLTGDTLADILRECHKAGIRVIARCDFKSA